MFKLICIAFAVLACSSAAPSGLLLGTSPLLAKIANAPEAPASTVHAAHVVAPAITYAAPLTYAAAPALSYAAPLSYTATGPALAYAAPLTYSGGYAYNYAPITQHGFKIAY